jgi:hypothetical protein
MEWSLLKDRYIWVVWLFGCGDVELSQIS